MSAVVEAVTSVVSGVVETAGSIATAVVDTAVKVVEKVADTAVKVVESAIEDPIGTIAKVVTAVEAPYLLPVVTAGDTIAHGGSITDAALSAGVSYFAPAASSEVTSALEGTAIGQGLQSLADTTGIESLPAAATKGLTTAAMQTGAGLASGQDLGTSLERGLTSGVGSTVGGVAASEADTGSALANKLIGTGVGAATTAALQGKDVENAVSNALAGNVVGYGLNQASQGLPSLASTDTTVTDAAPTPTEELMQKMQENAAPVEQTPEDAANTQMLLDALYPTSTATTEPVPEPTATTEPAPSTADQQMMDYLNNLDATGGTGDTTQTPAFGIEQVNPEVVSPTADQLGDYPQTASDVQLYNDILNNPQALSELIGTTGDQPGDYPQQVINNPDGTTTAVEFDGTQRVFNLDGSVTTISPDGTSTTEVPAPTAAPSTGLTQGVNLGALAQSLLSSGQTGSAGNWSPTALATLAGAGFLASQMGGADTGNQMNIGSKTFDWNQMAPWMPRNAIAYGQQFVNPTFAAQGGLMSITPTVGDQTTDNRFATDPSSAVQMYAHGGLSSLGSYSDGGRLLKGPGDGMSDHIPASIGNAQPARLADGEFVIPADVVSHLGNGSTDAGAKVLYDMMAKIRKARTGNPKQGKQINPAKFTPR